MNEYKHYQKSVEHLKWIDVYRVLVLFGVSNPCLQHAIKKLLCAGQRGAKDERKDIEEAVSSLVRCLEMQTEDENAKAKQ
jgi:hypothetical protein